MTDVPASVPPPPAATPTPARAWLRHPATWIAVVAALLALAQWYDVRARSRNVEQALAKRLFDNEAQAREARAVAETSREATREMQARVGVLETKLAESQNQQVALEALYQELSRSRDESVLADVEQTLLVANQQLQLAGNVKAALIALTAAESRLARLDRPQLAPLRKVLARDVERLKQAPFVDISGLSARLDGLLAGLDAWPLAMDARPREAAAKKAEAQPDAAPAWGRWAGEFWAELKNLVRIERIEGNEAPLLAPPQAYFLRENLRLRLTAARIALLARDEKSFQADLRAARDWLARYYDPRNPQVIAAAAQLKQLQDASVAIEVPGIDTSLEAVRNYRVTREKR
jgi:uroporphyrin-3 C-methyltransferase